MPPTTDEHIATIAQKYSFSIGAVNHLLAALRVGNGSAAQFNHPELGGMGQWMAGGMMMIGDWNNHALKARVAGACADLASLALQRPATNDAAGASFAPMGSSTWWPAELGTPNASGAQNGIRYAYFAKARRLVIEAAGRVDLYDTLDHQIAGVAQQQGTSTTLSFRSQKGVIALNDLPRIKQPRK